MYDDVGGMIKLFARGACYLGIGCCLLFGLLQLLEGHILFGIIIALLGSLGAWASSLTLYGFGQMVEASDILVEYIRKTNSGAQQPQRSPIEHIRKINSEVQQPQQTPSGMPNKKLEDLPPDAIIFPVRTELETVKCPKCGCTQMAYWDRCSSCGAPFFYETELK